MSEKYNDENLKKILESEQVPERLEPENIKKMLDSSGAVNKRKRIKQKKTLRIVSMAAALALAVGVSAYFARPALFSDKSVRNGSDSAVTVDSMKPAVEYKDIYSYFLAASNFNKFKDFIGSFAFGGNKDVDYEEYAVEESYDAIAEDEAADAEAGAPMQDTVTNGANQPESGSSTEKEHSDTYNQEEGVLEADIVKTDGDRIFYTNSDKLFMARVNKGKFVNSSITSVSELLKLDDDEYGCTLNDMYIHNGKLILISSVYEFDNDGYYYDGCYGLPSETDTYIMIVSVGDTLKLDGYFVQEGSYNTVRLMANGYLYLITNSEKYLDFGKVKVDDTEKYIPEYCVNGKKECVPADDIFIPSAELDDMYDYISYMNFSGLDLNSETPWQPTDMKSVAGYSTNVYCSQKNLYVVSGYYESDITRFALSKGTLNTAASGKIKGWVNDQFSMSEYNGYFRIAVTEDEAGRKNTVNVLDMGMNIVGSISDFGISEEIKSVNFSGDKAYVVTFRNTDPLYAIDLSDPTSPKMLDELKISGYSSYMQKWSDGMLVGFGAEADEESGFETGVKLTMFDNSDPNDLRVMDSVSVVPAGFDDEYIYSEGVYDRKALYIDPERNIIGFPVTNERFEDVYSTLYSYRFYSFDNGKLVPKGIIQKIFRGKNAYESFRRAVYIDGYMYAVSADTFKSADAVNFRETDTLEFEIDDTMPDDDFLLID